MRMELHWNDCQNELRVPLSNHNNVAPFRLAPGYGKYEAYCSIIGDTLESDDAPISAPAQVVSEDDDDDATESREDYSTKMIGHT
jgi:hypothetical protein